MEPCDSTLGGGDGTADRLECARRSSISLMLVSAGLATVAVGICAAGALAAASPGKPASGRSGIGGTIASIGDASACRGFEGCAR